MTAPHRHAPIALAIAFIVAAPAAMAQGFAPGNLIVSRTAYAGNASTVAIGQALPGGGVATNDGSFPNVFKNETPDPSFGVSSPIFLDRLSQSGKLLGTTAINANLVTTSFASKSELALNVSSDGKSISFMGYKAPSNSLDVSNSNTAAVLDPTNPVASTYQRAVVSVGLATGAVQVTGVDAYSGNNGRAAVQVGNTFYMVGNAGNGSGNGKTLSQLSDNTGVQSIAVGGSGATTAVGAVNGTFGSSTGYQRGFSLSQVADPAHPGSNYAPDKTGKDDNFRGMTVFDNTLYVTKGSGSNGVNTVYQVGATGALGQGTALSGAAITILPGFNSLSEKVAEAKGSTTATPHPFGLWFANSTTLFVADEGDGSAPGSAGKSTQYAGLQEWKLSNGTWSDVQTFQGGLLNQAAYSNGLPWSVQTDGLRNLTGETNADGTYTLFATTSTVSNESTHDQGADPNEIVSITIGANSTNANTSFNVLETAAYGQRFGGVALAPAAAVPEPANVALMLTGLGVVGLRLRARRRTQGV